MPPKGRPRIARTMWRRTAARRNGLRERARLGIRPEFQGGHEVALLRGGDALFPDMREAIGAARHTVWLATYIFHDDAAAEVMAECWPRRHAAAST